MSFKKHIIASLRFIEISTSMWVLSCGELTHVYVCAIACLQALAIQGLSSH